jgi:hypothetical protein
MMDLYGISIFQNVEEWYRGCVARMVLLAPIGCARLVDHLSYTTAMKDLLRGLL